MRFKLISTTAHAPVTLLAEYAIGRWNVQLTQKADGRVQWICGCERYRSSATRYVPPWCKHISKAAARRSVERVTGERTVTRIAAV